MITPSSPGPFLLRCHASSQTTPTHALSTELDSEDDPELETWKALHERGALNLRIVPGVRVARACTPMFSPLLFFSQPWDRQCARALVQVSVESSAKFIYDQVTPMIEGESERLGARRALLGRL